MGDVSGYLGVKIHCQDNKIILTQPQLIEQIIQDVKFPKGTKPVHVPAMVIKILTIIPEEPAHNPKLFDY